MFNSQGLLVIWNERYRQMYSIEPHGSGAVAVRDLWTLGGDVSGLTLDAATRYCTAALRARQGVHTGR